MALHDTRCFTKTLRMCFEFNSHLLWVQQNYLWYWSSFILAFYHENGRRGCFDSFLLVSLPVRALRRAKKRGRSRQTISLTFLEETATILARNPNNSVCYINSVGTIMPPAVTTLHAVRCGMQSSLSQRGWLPKELQSRRETYPFPKMLQV